MGGLSLGRRDTCGVIVITIGGELDIATAGELVAFVHCGRRPGDRVVLDLTSISFIDGSGLSALLRVQRDVARDGSAVHLVAPRQRIPARMLRLTCTDRLMPVHANLQHAIGAATAGRGPQTAQQVRGRLLREPGTAESSDLISVMTEDHLELRQLLTELEYVSEFEPLRSSLATLFVAEMVRHTRAEESFMHPLIRARLPKGQQMIEQEVVGHEQIEQALRGLERPDLSTAEFSRRLSRLKAEVRPHSRVEEEKLFPLLARHVSKTELTDLGHEAAQAKDKASIPQFLAEPDCPLLKGKPTISGMTLVERVRTYLRDAYPL